MGPFNSPHPLEKRLDRQACCAGILYECMRFLIGHIEINATEEFLSPRGVRTERRLAVADMNRIINVALCFGHGILLYPEGGYIAPISTGRTSLQLRDNAAGAAAFIAVGVA